MCYVTCGRLLLIPQRYEFSSKSQLYCKDIRKSISCCWYHKGTNFQANHNSRMRGKANISVVADTTKVRIFKQITTAVEKYFDVFTLLLIPQRYEFSSKSQLPSFEGNFSLQLLLIPQRYEFSSKSQLNITSRRRMFSCCWYHKGTNFQANHNRHSFNELSSQVVADTTKVRIFKQITTYWFCQRISNPLLLIPQRYEFSSKSQPGFDKRLTSNGLLLIPQRYEFSSKSQLNQGNVFDNNSCCWYHKGTNFQANHNTYI